MFPAPPLLLAIALLFAGLVAFFCGVIGLPTFAFPRCRRCRADVRSAGWDDAPRCPSCAAPLDGDGAVRWHGRRRSRRTIVAGLVMLLAAGCIWAADRAIAARGLWWRDLRPASWEFAAIEVPTGVERAALQSLMRRADADRLSEADLARLAELSVGAIRTTAAAGRPIDHLWFDAAITALPPGDDRLAAIASVLPVPPAAFARMIPSQISCPQVTPPWLATRSTWITAWEEIELDGTRVVEEGRLQGRPVLLDAVQAFFPLAVDPPRTDPIVVRGRWRLVLVPAPTRGVVLRALADGRPIDQRIAFTELRGTHAETLPQLVLEEDGTGGPP